MVALKPARGSSCLTGRFREHLEERVGGVVFDDLTDDVVTVGSQCAA